MSDHISCAETAKLVRTALREAFPEIKFSVKSRVYSGGASINVKWTDGPTSTQVEEIAKRFAGATFDGMTDSMNYFRTSMGGKPVSFGANFVFTSHDISPDRADAMVALLQKAGKDYWLTVCCDMNHPSPCRAVSMAGDDARELALSILHNCPSSAFEGRTSPLAQSVVHAD